MKLRNEAEKEEKNSTKNQTLEAKNVLFVVDSRLFLNSHLSLF